MALRSVASRQPIAGEHGTRLLIFTADEIELTEKSVAAQRIAKQLVVEDPARLEYVAGVVFAAITTEASIELQGLMLQFPACEEVGALLNASRLISWETLLPMLNSDVSEKQARALATRLRGLEKICNDYPQPPEDDP